MADDKKTIIGFSGDLDRAMAALIIARGAAAMGNEVTLFVTFWGLNLLRKPAPASVKKPLLDALFGWMMPRGAGRAKLSKLHMGGLGTAMMQHVMKTKHVPSLPEMLQEAQEFGVKFIACTMSMDVMGIQAEELIDGLEFAGVATYLGHADDANLNLFI